MEDQWLTYINVIYFLAYIVLSTLVLGRLLWRLLLYRTAKEPVPLLLKRDIPLFAVLVVEFGIILLARAFGVLLAGNVTWTLFSGGAAVIALGWWTYVEYFRIGD